ncbi:unnamed protein product, partial [Prorocentrum cordatum]
GRLMAIADARTAEGLAQHSAGADAHVDRARLGDLRDPGTDLSRMWRCAFGWAPAGRPSLQMCGARGEHLLDAAGPHASTCCIGEATVGHNPVKEELHRFAVMGDPRSELEPENLVRSRPLDRPADVLTAAVGRLSALDVGVTSSATAPAPGEDAAEAMWQRKNRERDSVRGELEELGIVYSSVVWTSHGRPHLQAAAVQRALRERIGAALARRGARTSLATVARLDDSAAEPGAGVWRELAAVDAAAAAGAQGSAPAALGGPGGARPAAPAAGAQAAQRLM